MNEPQVIRTYAFVRDGVLFRTVVTKMGKHHLVQTTTPILEPLPVDRRIR